jgi:hypothetical protein
MSKLSIADEVGRISAFDKQPQNPFALRGRANDMTHDELMDDRDGEACGSPVGGWDR